MSSATRALMLPLVGFLLSGCATSAPTRTATMEGVEGIDATAREMETLLYRFAEHFAGELDLATNEIFYGTQDYDMRMAVLQWNANAVPEMLMCCFHFDPLTGLLGAGAFVVQMVHFFEDGNGKDLFGPQQHVAIETSRRLQQDLLALAQEVWPGGDFEKYRQAVLQWAEAHPIENTRFVRSGFDMETVRKSGASPELGMRLAGSINAQLLALNDRANIMTAYLPRMAHWEEVKIMEQSKLMIADLTDTTMSKAVRNLSPLLQFLAEQRALTMRDLSRERMAVLEAITQERTSLLLGIANERKATLQEISSLTLATVDRLMSGSQGVVTTSIDQVIRRLAMIMLMPFAALVVLVLVVMIWVRNTVSRVLKLRTSVPERS